MPEKRSYTAILASVETHIIYMATHLKNIDQHLCKINDTLYEHNEAINSGKERVNNIYRVTRWGWKLVAAFFMGLVIATPIVLNILGVI